ncbi:hypothetical protein EV426DRAFT_704398 [Tirmania nivea]|nr:hypothetical protein EV426DRAFT_704398 [Tirmania nivea]
MSSPADSRYDAVPRTDHCSQQHDQVFPDQTQLERAAEFPSSTTPVTIERWLAEEPTASLTPQGPSHLSLQDGGMQPLPSHPSTYPSATINSSRTTNYKFQGLSDYENSTTRTPPFLGRKGIKVLLKNGDKSRQYMLEGVTEWMKVEKFNELKGEDILRGAVAKAAKEAERLNTEVGGFGLTYSKEERLSRGSCKTLFVWDGTTAEYAIEIIFSGLVIQDITEAKEVPTSAVSSDVRRENEEDVEVISIKTEERRDLSFVLGRIVEGDSDSGSESDWIYRKSRKKGKGCVDTPRANDLDIKIEDMNREGYLINEGRLRGLGKSRHTVKSLSLEEVSRIMKVVLEKTDEVYRRERETGDTDKEVKSMGDRDDEDAEAIAYGSYEILSDINTAGLMLDQGFAIDGTGSNLWEELEDEAVEYEKLERKAIVAKANKAVAEVKKISKKKKKNKVLRKKQLEEREEEVKMAVAEEIEKYKAIDKNLVNSEMVADMAKRF